MGSNRKRLQIDFILIFSVYTTQFLDMYGGNDHIKKIQSEYLDSIHIQQILSDSPP